MFNIYFFIFLLTVVISSFSQILLKKAALNKYPNKIREYMNALVISGYFLMFASMVMTIIAYKGVEYKNGMIIESLGNVLVLILSHYFFKEKITLNKVMGIALILCGFVVFYL